MDPALAQSAVVDPTLVLPDLTMAPEKNLDERQKLQKLQARQTPTDHKNSGGQEKVDGGPRGEPGVVGEVLGGRADAGLRCPDRREERHGGIEHTNIATIKHICILEEWWSACEVTLIRFDDANRSK